MDTHTLIHISLKVADWQMAQSVCHGQSGWNMRWTWQCVCVCGQMDRWHSLWGQWCPNDWLSNTQGSTSIKTHQTFLDLSRLAKHFLGNCVQMSIIAQTCDLENYKMALKPSTIQNWNFVRRQWRPNKNRNLARDESVARTMITFAVVVAAKDCSVMIPPLLNQNYCPSLELRVTFRDPVEFQQPS